MLCDPIKCIYNSDRLFNVNDSDLREESFNNYINFTNIIQGNLLNAILYTILKIIHTINHVHMSS